MKFSKWLLNEFKIDFDRMFGCSDGNAEFADEKQSDKPIQTINIEFISEELAKQPIGFKDGASPFVGENIWGDGVGALQCQISPKNYVYIKKSAQDLQGNLVWLTKRVYLIDRSGAEDGCEPSIVRELASEINLVNEEPLDSPVGDYDAEKFSTLVQQMTQKVIAVINPVFVFQRIKRLNENNYIIEFELRGAGVQGPGQQQITVNHINMCYLPDRGLIKIFDNNVSNKTGRGRKWSLDVMQSHYYFSPTQSKDEIIGAITTTMKDY